MKDIVTLEIENLTEKQKQELINQFSYKENLENKKDDYRRRIQVNESDPTKRKYRLDDYDGYRVDFYDTDDDVLANYFDYNPDMFIRFQKENENSLYNQAIKEYNFSDSSIEDKFKQLSDDERKVVAKTIAEYSMRYLSTPEKEEFVDEEDEEKYQEEFKQVEIKEIEEKDKIIMEKAAENWEGFADELFDLENKYPGLSSNLDDYLYNNYVEVSQDYWEDIDIHFYRDAFYLIREYKDNEDLRFRMIGENQKYFSNTHVNQWIEKKHKFDELVEKKDIEALERFAIDTPTKKMKM